MTSPCRSCVTLLVVEENDSEAECTVCIDTLKPGQEARSLPCKHTFHRNINMDKNSNLITNMIRLINMYIYNKISLKNYW